MASGRYAIDRTSEKKAQIDSRDERLTFGNFEILLNSTVFEIMGSI